MLSNPNKYILGSDNILQKCKDLTRLINKNTKIKDKKPRKFKSEETKRRAEEYLKSIKNCKILDENEEPVAPKNKPSIDTKNKSNDQKPRSFSTYAIKRYYSSKTHFNQNALIKYTDKSFLEL